MCVCGPLVVTDIVTYIHVTAVPSSGSDEAWDLSMSSAALQLRESAACFVSSRDDRVTRRYGDYNIAPHAGRVAAVTQRERSVG
jgi:hypothetical protein